MKKIIVGLVIGVILMLAYLMILWDSYKQSSIIKIDPEESNKLKRWVKARHKKLFNEQ